MRDVVTYIIPFYFREVPADGGAMTQPQYEELVHLIRRQVVRRIE